MLEAGILDGSRIMDRLQQTRGVQAHQTVDGFTPVAARSVQRVVHRRIDSAAFMQRRFARPGALPVSSVAEVGTAQLPGSSPQAETSSAAPAVRITMNLPGQPSDAHPKRAMVWRKQWSAFRRWTFRSAVALLVIVVGVGGFLFAEGYLKLHQVFKGGASAAALQANVDPSLLHGEGDGRVNILLLGIGGAHHDGGDLTDTIMIASIDPVNKTADLLSIPRDLWVNVANYGQMKINAAYETGKYKYLGEETLDSGNTRAVRAGLDLADQVVEDVVGVPIHYNVLVNFQAFQQSVDTVGGVTINVPAELYDPTMAWENNWNPVLAAAGVQHFNGKKALLYARSRETSSDFARGERQRALIMALKAKVVSLGTLSNPVKIAGLMSAFGNNVQTDFSLADATRLFSIVKDIGDSKVKSLGLTDAPHDLVTTGNMNGLSIVKPKAGLFDYSAIQDYVRSTLRDGYIVKENARIVVLNGSGQPGLATDEATKLKSYGYNIVRVDNAPTPTYAQTMLVDLTHGKDKYTKHYLEQRFKVNATTQLPDTAIQTSGADFVLVLGNDNELPD